jgi:NitT/TauT family transport system substrate-binding protein
MKRSLRLGVSAATLAALAVLSACGGGDSSSSSDGTSGATARLELAIPSAVFAPKEEVATYAVGTAEGYLAEEKLKVDVINTDGSVAAVQAVASGSADITPADAGAILAAREKGVPVKAIGGLVQNWPWRMAVQPFNEDIRTPADLKGKKIGVISLASGSAIYARAYAEDAGLDAAKDIELLPVGVGVQARSALEHGKVDVLALYTQAYTTIENTGIELHYLDNSEAFDGIRSLTFAVTERTLREKKDVLTRYLRASYKALLFSAVNPEAAMRDGYKVFPQLLTGKKADDRIADDRKSLNAWIKTAVPATGEPESFRNWGAISDEEWAKTVAYTKASGQVTKDVSLPDLWDDGLLRGANDFDSAAVIEKAKAAE